MRKNIFSIAAVNFILLCILMPLLLGGYVIFSFTNYLNDENCNIITLPFYAILLFYMHHFLGIFCFFIMNLIIGIIAIKKLIKRKYILFTILMISALLLAFLFSFKQPALHGITLFSLMTLISFSMYYFLYKFCKTK